MKTVHLEVKSDNQQILKHNIRLDSDVAFAEVVLYRLKIHKLSAAQKSLLMSTARVCPVINIHEGQEVVISLDQHDWVRVWS